MAQNYASVTVSGEVIGRDHREHSCLLAIWQNVCNMQFQSFYVRAIFQNRDRISPLLPDLHSPLSFSGILTKFKDREAVIEIENICERHSNFCSLELGTNHVLS